MWRLIPLAIIVLFFAAVYFCGGLRRCRQCNRMARYHANYCHRCGMCLVSAYD